MERKPKSEQHLSLTYEDQWFRVVHKFHVVKYADKFLLFFSPLQFPLSSAAALNLTIFPFPFPLPSALWLLSGQQKLRGLSAGRGALRPEWRGGQEDLENLHHPQPACAEGKGVLLAGTGVEVLEFILLTSPL